MNGTSSLKLHPKKIKICDGVWELGEVTPFTISGNPSIWPEWGDEASHCEIQVNQTRSELEQLARSLTSTHTEGFHWAHGGSAASGWHYDANHLAKGIQEKYAYRPNHLLICTLCNDYTQGTVVDERNPIQLQAWHIYLLQALKVHKSPSNLRDEWRVFLRFYLRIGK